MSEHLFVPQMGIVVARLFGGLGNQLFIYSAARRLALANNMELLLDNHSGFVNDHQYRRHYQLNHFSLPCRVATPSERLEPFSRVRRYLMRNLNALLPFHQRNYILQDGIDFDHRLCHLRPKAYFYLEGYWQSERYFKDVEDQIRNDLRFIVPCDLPNRETAHRIGLRPSVAVHIRFFRSNDTFTADPNLAHKAMRSYYRRAIQLMESRVTDAHYFVFSDRPSLVKSFIPLDDSRMTLVNHNCGDTMAYADLWLMSQCQNFIIANSTFSWWGAWLSTYSTKNVIAPGFVKREGVGAWGFEGLIPNDWFKL